MNFSGIHYTIKNAICSPWSFWIITSDLLTIKREFTLWFQTCKWEGVRVRSLVVLWQFTPTTRWYNQHPTSSSSCHLTFTSYIHTCTCDLEVWDAFVSHGEVTTFLSDVILKCFLYQASIVYCKCTYNFYGILSSNT